MRLSERAALRFSPLSMRGMGSCRHIATIIDENIVLEVHCADCPNGSTVLDERTHYDARR
jgi:hypothetical protein|tara:strand:+ start:243 stop:422 length:180 start_codon:yes stop_codon:yes gene_type:complete